MYMDTNGMQVEYTSYNEKVVDVSKQKSIRTRKMDRLHMIIE